MYISTLILNFKKYTQFCKLGRYGNLFFAGIASLLFIITAGIIRGIFNVPWGRTFLAILLTAVFFFGISLILQYTVKQDLLGLLETAANAIATPIREY